MVGNSETSGCVNWRNIPIALTDLNFGEEKAHTYAKAIFQQQSTVSVR